MGMVCVWKMISVDDVVILAKDVWLVVDDNYTNRFKIT